MPRHHRRRRLAVAGLLWALVALLGQPLTSQSTSAQGVPDWLSEESAASLGVGIDVLVPPSLPAPFSGEPSIEASSGAYSLYWVVGGGAPTFLQITGVAGGFIPDYSKYDRNVELTQNATVAGYPAYHDLTPIYDLVYWDTGGVVYSVEVQNASSDALSIAGSLISLAVPEPEPGITASITSPDEIEAGGIGNVNVSVSGSATLTTDLGSFLDSGGSSVAVSGDATVAWQAPDVSEEIYATFQVIDDASGSIIASAPTLVIPADSGEDPSLNEPESDATEVSSNDPTEEPAEIEWSLGCPGTTSSGETVALTVSGRGDATLTANAGVFAGNAPAATVAVDGSVDVEWTAPSDADGTTALISLTSGEESVAACEIEIGSGGADDDRATRRPNAFPGDGTDLSLGRDDEPELADLEPTRVSTATPEIVTGGPLDDGTGIREGPLVATPVIPSPTPDPDDTPAPTETPKPTATSTPENPIPTLVPSTSSDGLLVAQEFGPEGGRLPTSFGAMVQVPAGASEDRMIVTVKRIPDDQLPIGATVDLVPDSGVEVTLAKSDGRMIDSLPQPALLRVDLGDRYRAGATLFSLADGQLIPLDNVETDGDTLEVPLRRVSRIVAGVPIGANAAATTSTSLVPFVIFALTAVIVVVVIGSVVGSARRRRPRSVVPRRVTSSRAR